MNVNTSLKIQGHVTFADMDGMPQLPSGKAAAAHLTHLILAWTGRTDTAEVFMPCLVISFPGSNLVVKLPVTVQCLDVLETIGGVTGLTVKNVVKADNG